MFCSTSEVYGNIGADERKITTKDMLMPANPYGASKAAIDLYMQERMVNGVIKGFITRAFSHTGPRRGKNFSISCDAYQLALMKQDKHKEGLELGVGNLSTTRVVMDVRDTVNAYYILMQNIEKTNGKIFNVCGNIPRKMQFFTDKLIEIGNFHYPVIKKVNPAFYRKHDIYYQHGDCSDLYNLGWKETYNIDKTLEDLYYYWVKKIWG
jgi:nucleoside-diphosphate-sugar epimerase